jgi:hypothetical protein
MTLNLDLQAMVVPLRRGTTIDEQFRDFHEANPHVFNNLRTLALRLKQQGRTRIGMKMLFEVLRYQYLIHTEGDAFRLNNNYTSRYTRLLCEKEPSLGGLFETRSLRS